MDAYGKPEIPYSMHDARHALITISGDSAWAVDFWTRYVEGHELPDYAALLEPAGFCYARLRPDSRGSADPSARHRRDAAVEVAEAVEALRPTRMQRPGHPARVNSAPAGTPLYAAGLDAGDLITAVDGKDVEYRGGVLCNGGVTQAGRQDRHDLHQPRRHTFGNASRSRRTRPCRRSLSRMRGERRLPRNWLSVTAG